MKKILFLVFTIAFFSKSLLAQMPSQAENPGMSFLKIGMGAKASGMGEAFVGKADGLSSLYWNPAGISESQGIEITFMHNQWFQDITTEYLASALKVKGNVFAFSLTLNQVPDIPRRTKPTDVPLSTYDAHQAAFGISFSRKITPKISLGFSGKWLYEKIDISSASGLGMDLGALFSLLKNMKLGLVVSNFGQKIKFEQQEFSLPTAYKAGFSYYLYNDYLKGDFSFDLDAVKLDQDSDLKIHFGLEYLYSGILALRGGYQLGYDEKSYTLGFGLKMKSYGLDYAFVPFESDLGSTHRISLNLRIK
ncbi:MAG: hypothetical protein AMJ90_07930 [candidate division Zixibacteria bacterium SM23_73_2]|nr:MAG: hypothetical protein AMJ90_07930 [candidate division Zixibacteria bacterium SM23_73_2]